ncbi:hypothetical protein HER10_EVM0001089 [Colletotrichum scovillei]|uniref:uncharacterized protein n=1 Tax=Colletotrichum scovillei TaxID=1209932 RepID=UPI0015C37D3C|nr:uncharacterized protein HER10_EVM0001089 [Colletotrichum scovillei]KAF4773037.1 hypothetical protein HER10_EVM0001089 [Colletotrichum scovillei]KAG7056656.1 RTA-like protein [Colletotrichum scovillei]
MGTIWRTEPLPPHLFDDMASSSSRKPQIFVHFEFGVSFSPRHAPNQHSVTYATRGFRDRAQFPRQVPPTNTNYLAEPSHSAHQQQQLQPTRSSPPIQEYYAPQAQPPMPPHYEVSRQSRQESRSSSSHERGSSAPPPWNDSPWDAEPDALGSSALPRQRPRPQNAPDYWKALPEVPSRFRLGEDEMPWSTSSWPGEFGMPDESEVNDYSSELSMKFRDVSLTNATPVAHERGDDGRRHDLEALSAAMVTVDNGFENQWWYQGERQQINAPGVVAGDLHTTTTTNAAALASTTTTAEAVVPLPQTPVYHQQQLGSYDTRESMGWVTAQGGDSHASMMSATIYNPSVLVSPMSEYASPRLHRSMTTRSEELFFYS